MRMTWEPLGCHVLRRFGVAVFDRRAVVAGEKHESVVRDAEFVQEIEDAACAGVEFLNTVAIHAVLRFSGKRGRGVLRHMRHGVRQVEKEGPLAMPTDEVECPQRVFFREQRLIHGLLDDAVAITQGEGFKVGELVKGAARGPFVGIVGMADAEDLVEALILRAQLAPPAEVPFADEGGRIADRFQHLRQRDFLGWQAGVLAGKEHIRHTATSRQSAREQRGPGRTAKRRGHIKIREAHALCRHAVDARRGDHL